MIMNNSINDNVLNVNDYGADPTGLMDSTEAIQNAINDGEKISGVIYIPVGEYLVKELFVKSHIELRGDATWSYRGANGSILKLSDKNAKSLLNLSQAIGVTLSGLVLDGGKIGTNIHGVMRKKHSFSLEEDTTRVEKCKIMNFSGDGIHFDKIWCFTVRFSMMQSNIGHGLYMNGWDGFLLDNWFSGNGKWGVYFDKGSNALTLTSNRVEWNNEGGLCFLSGGMCNVSNNYIDRSGGPGICIKPYESKEFAGCFTLTSNVIYRNGAQNNKKDKYKNCHVYFEKVTNLCFANNVLSIGRGDGGQGNWSPQYGIVIKELRNSIIKDNVINNSALKEVFLDLGKHGEGCILKNNVGKKSISEPESWLMWE